MLEAIGKQVQFSPLESFLGYTGNPAILFRLKPEFRHLIPKAISFGFLELGKPYDDAFLPENGKWYCSELLYEAFKHANNGKPVFSLSPMTFKKPGGTAFFPIWVEYFSKLGMETPEGIPGCNPGGMSRSEMLELVGTFSP